MENNNEEQVESPKPVTFSKIEVSQATDTAPVQKENPIARFAKKLGFGRENTQPISTPESNPQPTNRGQDALASYSASKTPEELDALRKTQAEIQSLVDSEQVQTATASKIAPAIKLMENGDGFSKITS